MGSGKAVIKDSQSSSGIVGLTRRKPHWVDADDAKTMREKSGLSTSSEGKSHKEERASTLKRDGVRASTLKRDYVRASTLKRDYVRASTPKRDEVRASSYKIFCQKHDQSTRA